MHYFIKSNYFWEKLYCAKSFELPENTASDYVPRTARSMTEQEFTYTVLKSRKMVFIKSLTHGVGIFLKK